VQAFLGDSADLTVSETELREAVAAADAVVVGLSSQMEFSVVEMQVCEEARCQNVPFGLFSDTFGCFKRGHFAPFRIAASWVFVSSQREVVDARRMFPQAMVVVSGNPTWEAFAHNQYARPEARELLGCGDELVILCPGNKSVEPEVPNHNIHLVESVAYALAMTHAASRVLFLSHPSDRAAGAYYDVHMPDHVTRLDRNDPEITAKAVRACDVVVSLCSPSVDLQALLLGTPVINIYNSEVEQRLVGELGMTTPPLVQYGYVYYCAMKDYVDLSRLLAFKYGLRLDPAGVLPPLSDSSRRIVDALR